MHVTEAVFLEQGHMPVRPSPSRCDDGAPVHLLPASLVSLQGTQQPGPIMPEGLHREGYATSGTLSAAFVPTEVMPTGRAYSTAVLSDLHLESMLFEDVDHNDDAERDGHR